MHVYVKTRRHARNRKKNRQAFKSGMDARKEYFRFVSKSGWKIVIKKYIIM